jgi:hypothetical protein
MTQTLTTPTLPSAVVRGSLEHGLLFCLGLRAKAVDEYELAAVAWHARWCSEHAAAGYDDARSVLDALELIGGDDPHEGVRSLRDALSRWDDRHLTQILDDWIARQARAGR